MTAKKKLDEIERVIDYLRFPPGTETEKQLRRKLRALVRKAYFKGIDWIGENTEEEMQKLFGFRP